MKKITLFSLVLLLSGCKVSTDHAQEMTTDVLNQIVVNAPKLNEFENKESFEKATVSYYESLGVFKSKTKLYAYTYNEMCKGYPLHYFFGEQFRLDTKQLVTSDPFKCVKMDDVSSKSPVILDVDAYYRLTAKFNARYFDIEEPCNRKFSPSGCSVYADDARIFIKGKEYPFEDAYIALR